MDKLRFPGLRNIYLTIQIIMLSSTSYSQQRYILEN